jgi:hypothetical protein
MLLLIIALAAYFGIGFGMYVLARLGLIAGH